MATSLSSNKTFQRAFIMFIILSLFISLLYPNTVAHAISFVVNSTADLPDSNQGDGLCETEIQGECTLRAAIMEANSLLGADVIVIPNGIYFLSFEHNPNQFDLEINDDLTINGESAENTIIDGNMLDRVLHIIGANIVTINNLTIQHGLTLGWDGSILGYGGGIANEGTNLVISNSVIRENTSDQSGGGIFNGIGGDLHLNNVIVTNNISGSGGGIFNNGRELIIQMSTINGNSSIQEGGGISNRPEYIDYNFVHSSIIDSVISNNNSGYQGGGLYNSNYSHTQITNSTFRDNTTYQEGGGVFNAGDIEVDNSTISGNIAQNGGGFFNNGLLIVNNSSITSNSAYDASNNGFGGGISNQLGGVSTSGTVTLNNVFIGNNIANFGGGIANQGYISIVASNIEANSTNPSDGGGIWNGDSSIAQIANAIFVNNNSGDRGGAIYNWGEIEVTNSTFVSNTASQGGHAIHNIGSSIISFSTLFDNTALYGDRAAIQIPSGSVIFQNSIISNNDSTTAFNCDLGIIDGGHNIDTGSTCGFEIANGSISNTNPLLAPLANNGGLTLTLALLPNSPAIDAGNNSNCPSTDQRGISRPVDGNGDSVAICDIGAFEAEQLLIYNFNGFFQPIDNLPILNVAKAGSAIPVKFSLGGDQGLGIFATGYPSSAQVTCGTTAEDAIEETVTSGSSSLSYNASTGIYNYIWKTQKSWAGTCRTLVIKLSDGTYHRANFKFK